MRAVLLAGQVAMTLVLVIGAALFVRSLRAAVTTDVSVDVDRIFYASVLFPFASFDEAQIADFYDSVGARLGGMPGVERVTFGDLPLAHRGGGTPEVTVDGRTRRLPQLMWILMSGPDYREVGGSGAAVGAGFRSARRGGLGGGGDSQRIAGPAPLAGSQPSRPALHVQNPLTADVQVVGVVGEGKYRGLPRRR